MANTHTEAKKLSQIGVNIPKISPSLSLTKNEDTPAPETISAVYEPNDRGRAWKLHNGFDQRHATPSLKDCSMNKNWHDAYNSATSIIKRGGMVCLTGNRGTGKTQLAYHLVKEFFRANDTEWMQGPIKYAVYGTALGFFIAIKSTYGNSEISEHDLIASLSNMPIMVIDEMQVRSDTAWENSMLTHLIDSRYGKMLGTILISNQATQSFINSIGPSIADRIRETGGIIEMNWESLRGKTTKG